MIHDHPTNRSTCPTHPSHFAPRQTLLPDTHATRPDKTRLEYLVCTGPSTRTIDPVGSRREDHGSSNLADEVISMYTAYAALYIESHYTALGPIRRISSLALGTMDDVVQEEGGIMWWIRLSSTALPTTSDPMTRMVHGDEVVPI